MNKNGRANIRELIAHWNLEHEPDERKAHLDRIRGFLKETGLDQFLTARMIKPAELWSLGWPKTRIDVHLRKPYRHRVYRHRRTGARSVDLSVIHLMFARQAGVYGFDRHVNEVHELTWECKGPEGAARISAWDGWDGTVCDYFLRTDAKHYGYRCRLPSGYGGEPGDSFGYGPDWDDVHRQVCDALYRIVDELGLRYIKR